MVNNIHKIKQNISRLCVHTTLTEILKVYCNVYNLIKKNIYLHKSYLPERQLKVCVF